MVGLLLWVTGLSIYVPVQQFLLHFALRWSLTLKFSSTAYAPSTSWLYLQRQLSMQSNTLYPTTSRESHKQVSHVLRREEEVDSMALPAPPFVWMRNYAITTAPSMVAYAWMD